MIPNQGQIFAAKCMFKAGHNLRLRLFSNDVTPGAATVVGDLTQVATANGYAEDGLADADWTLDADGDATHPAVDFQATGGNFTAYGYYIVGDDPENPGTDLLFAATRFASAPLTAVADGLPIRVVPTINNSDA